MSRFAGQRLVVETPEMYASGAVQAFIRMETQRPCKQWVMDVINGGQESECVKLRTIDFLLLPDTERVNRYWRAVSSEAVGRRYYRPPQCTLNWLAIATEPGLSSLRDLRGRHVGMLKNLLQQTQLAIHEETGLQPEEIMAYVHYPPSVYQLHIHFAHPYAC
jgi:m7GpppX diphosphatase